jgi:predicted nucleic acid-binding protein
MKYVLDSRVALTWVLAEADSVKAIRLRDEYKQGLHELLAPDIFLPEIANALAAAERQGRIKTGESALLLHDVVRAAPALHPAPPPLLRAMALAIATRRAVYDCIYLALVEPKAASW